MTETRLGARLLAALVLGAFGPVAGQEADAPLEESKRALQQMRKEQGTPAPAGALREAAPVIRGPEIKSPGPSVPPPSGKRPREQTERQSRAQREWLADGVRGLERERRGTAGLVGEGEADAEEGELDPSDPDFLLKAYQRQEREGRTAGSTAPDRERAPPPAPAADPMEPFLRDWLKGSPVEALVLGARRSSEAARLGTEERRTETSLGGPTSAPIAERTAPPSAWSLAGESRGAGENPFLQILTPVAQPAAAGGPASPLPGLSPMLELPGASSAGPRLPPPVAEPAPVGPRERKPPPSPLQENEKYFPQQRKF